MKIIVMNCSKGMAQKKREAQEEKEMILRIKAQTPAARKREAQYLLMRKAAGVAFAQIDTTLLKYRKYRMLVALAYAAFFILIPGAPAIAAGAGGAAGGIAILKLMQQASFWVGIGVVVWGIIGAQLDLPGWKGRILKGIIGYIAILLIPILFITLRENLQIDIWNKLS